MKRIVYLILICLCFITGCNSEEEINYKTISSNEAYDMITKREDVIILDVRSESEFMESHIEGSVNIPLGSIERFQEEVTDNKKSTILVYCASGNRSKEAGKPRYVYG